MLFSKEKASDKGRKDQPASIVIEVTAEQKKRWEEEAQKRGLSLDAFVKGCVNAVVHNK